ncbi:hypothetical protein [Pseudomonas boanensis]|uniref:hypothetical protein n=1 Tax=Metapseudomonas boanensis TaxID=2822138 RepID=UPI0035D51A7C
MTTEDQLIPQNPATEAEGESTAPAPAAKKQSAPWYQGFKSHDRGQRPGPAPRGTRRSMGKR